ncbi:MAG: glycosyltransferase family 4 protein [Dokdonella sp.]
MRLLVIAGFAESIVSFRGALIGALMRAGYDVHIAAPGISLRPQIGQQLGLAANHLHDVPMARAGTNPVSDLKTSFALYRLMRKIRPDTVLPYTIKAVIYGTLAAWFARVPRRFALVTGLGYAFSGKKEGGVKRLVYLLYGIALARTTKVFFQNPDDDRQLRELGILPAQIPSVVINGSGVDVSAYGVAPMPPLPTTFLLIARLLGDKGVREYADAARTIRKQHPQSRFLLVGWIDANPDSISQPELDRWVSEGIIEFLGKLADVRPVIAGASVYVLPSVREGTPRTVLEAMAMGRPIITTDAPGCRETVVDGENGFLVPVKSVDALVEAMQRFIDDPSLAARLGKRSREIAEEKYDVHKVNAVMLREMGITAQHASKGAST